METYLEIAYFVQFLALGAVVAIAGALVLSTVYELLQNKMRQADVVGSVSWQEIVRGSALQDLGLER